MSDLFLDPPRSQALLTSCTAGVDLTSLKKYSIQRFYGRLPKKHCRIVTQDLVMSSNAALPDGECTVQNLKEDEDDAYFGSYGHFAIHQEMLQVI